MEDQGGVEEGEWEGEWEIKGSQERWGNGVYESLGWNLSQERSGRNLWL